MLRRVVAVLASLAVQFSSAAALAAIGFSVSSPPQGAVEGTSLSVSVVVNSTYAVQSVSAQVGSVAANLTAPSSSGQPWTGTLAIGALPYGSQTLAITATDALSNTGSTTVTFLHHNPPVIQVTGPIDGTVARPTVTLVATCSDDTGCLYVPSGQTTPQPGFEVTFAGQAVTTSTNSLNQTIDLTAYDGQELNLTFTAMNSDRETTSVTQPVYVDTSARLVPVATVPGLVLDFDSTRVLYETADNAVLIRDRQTQADTTLGTAVNGSGPLSGSLTSVGAVWFYSDVLGCSHTTWWAGGQATSNPDCTIPNIAGDWACVDGPASPMGTMGEDLVSLVTGVTTFEPFPQPDDSGTNYFIGATVTAQGDVFGFVAQPDSTTSIYRNHAGTVTRVGASVGWVNNGTHDGAPFAMTDGANLVYATVDATSVPAEQSIAVFSNGTEQLLFSQPYASGGVAFAPGADFQVNNGWVAFRETQQGVPQVWVRAPTGTTTQLSVYNTGSAIDAIGPTGEVMFLNAGDLDAGVAPGRYLRIPPALPERINSQLGIAVAGCDGWYVKMGGTLFQVAGTADAGTGVCPTLDAGTNGGVGPDSGVDGAAGSDAGTGSSDASTEPDRVMGPGAGFDAEGQGSSDQDAPASGQASGGGGCTMTAPQGVSGGWFDGVAFLVAASLARRSRFRP